MQKKYSCAPSTFSDWQIYNKHLYIIPDGLHWKERGVDFHGSIIGRGIPVHCGVQNDSGTNHNFRICRAEHEQFRYLRHVCAYLWKSTASYFIMVKF